MLFLSTSNTYKSWMFCAYSNESRPLSVIWFRAKLILDWYIVSGRSVFPSSGFVSVVIRPSRWGCCRLRWNSVRSWRISIVLLLLRSILGCRSHSGPTTRPGTLLESGTPAPHPLYRSYLFTTPSACQRQEPQRLSCTLGDQFNYCLHNPKHTQIQLDQILKPKIR